MKRIVLPLLAAAGLVFAQGALAQDNFPSRPVKMIVPYPAGGGGDILARALADAFQKSTGQPMGVENRAGSWRMLEGGPGSGGIARYFATRPAGHVVHAVDVIDSRLSGEGYQFTRVEGTALPFDDATFDVVLSNHVIEHVGEVDAQYRHLAEPRPVLRPVGHAGQAQRGTKLPAAPQEFTQGGGWT